MTETRDGEPLSIGRKSRVVPKGIDRDFFGNWSFFRPDGIAVPDCGYHSRDMLDDDIVYEDQGERYDNPPRGGLLSAVEKLVNEPPPPRYFH